MLVYFVLAAATNISVYLAVANFKPTRGKDWIRPDFLFLVLVAIVTGVIVL